MVFGDDWDAQRMFDLYVHDYLVKKNMHRTAAIFKEEANIWDHEVVFHASEGFLNDWWSIFYDVYDFKQRKAEEALKGINVGVKPMTTLSNDFEEVEVTSFMKKVVPFLSDDDDDANSTSTPLNGGKLLDSEKDEITPLMKTVKPFLYDDDDANSTSTPFNGPKGRHTASTKNELKGAGMNVGVKPMTTLSNDSEEVEVTSFMKKVVSFLSDDDDDANSTSIPLNGGKLLDFEQDEITPLMEKVKPFLYDDDDANSTSTPFNGPKDCHTASTKNELKGFTFNNVTRFNLNKDKVLCCHFSSNGNLLASAGHEKKVCILNLETSDTIKTSEAHNLLITDVRFKPNSTIFATSSFDRTVKVWDTARPNRLILGLHGHKEQVTSLDFHPTTTDLLCSCDVSDEIRMWNVNQSVCTFTSKGAMKQVRFEPCFGKFLATASGNRINLFDVETGCHQFSLKGHVNDVISVSWDQTGKYIVSISEESARLWSISSREKCIHELHANDNKFQSCTFHPKSSNLIVIGGYQLIDLWSPFDTCRALSVPAHKGLVSALAKSEDNEMVASASHDWCVKLWE